MSWSHEVGDREGRRLRVPNAVERVEGQQGAGFVVRGTIDGRQCVARWTQGELVADAELLRRAEAVVALGERSIDAFDGAGVVVASLEGGSLEALLAVMRAFTRVVSVELPFEAGPDDRDGDEKRWTRSRSRVGQHRPPSKEYADD